MPGDEEFRKCYIIIDNIKAEDNGEWKCIVKDFGLASEDSHTFDLTVLDKKQSNMLEPEKLSFDGYHPKKLSFPPHSQYQDNVHDDKIDELFEDIHDIIDEVPDSTVGHV